MTENQIREQIERTGRVAENNIGKEFKALTLAIISLLLVRIYLSQGQPTPLSDPQHKLIRKQIEKEISKTFSNISVITQAGIEYSWIKIG